MASSASMDTPTYRSIWVDGLWRNNVGFVQLLGLCPLLAVSNSVVNALGLGLATILTVTLSNLIVSSLRHRIRPEVRIPFYVLIIAAVVTCVELSMNAFAHDLHRALGIFVPLIVANCAILARAESFASRNSPLRATIDGFATGLGFAAILLGLGAMRELLGRGTLLYQARHLFGEAGEAWTVTLWSDGSGFLIVLLPPGAFLMLGFVLAGKRYWETRRRAPLPIDVSKRHLVP